MTLLTCRGWQGSEHHSLRSSYKKRTRALNESQLTKYTETSKNFTYAFLKREFTEYFLHSVYIRVQIYSTYKENRSFDVKFGAWTLRGWFLYSTCQNVVWILCFKTVLHGPIFLATCNAILLLRDANLATTKLLCLLHSMDVFFANLHLSKV